MTVSTFTIIAGNMECLNRCPCCISKMTDPHGVSYMKPSEVDWEAFRKAVNIAELREAQNVLITGKGEPTMFPFDISRFLYEMRHARFERRELQTEGSLLYENKSYEKFLEQWRYLGLDVIALSIYSSVDSVNDEIFRPRDDSRPYNRYILGKKLRGMGYRVRWSCMMLKGYVDSPAEVDNLIKMAKIGNIFQLTLRMADRPRVTRNDDVAKYVDEHRLSEEQFLNIKLHLDKKGRLMDYLPHGALVYDVDGQNVCLTTGLSENRKDEVHRHLIFFPQGWLTTSWERVQGGRVL